MKLETHSHSKGGSHCADADPENFAAGFANALYDGVVITNHLSKDSYAYLQGETHAQKVRFYYSLIEAMTDTLQKYGIKCFWGTEVRVLADEEGKKGEEFTVYGIPEKAMYDSPPLYTYTQEQLFRFAEKRGLFMYQTHPFRDRVTVGNPKFMHGAEAFNGHFHHCNHNPLAEEFCERNNLIKMSGTDFHHDNQPITAGIIVPEYVTDENSLIECLFKKDFQLFKDEILYERTLKEYKESK